MPTEVKTSAQYADLGDLSSFSISTAAIPVDTADSSGSIPSISTTFVDGADEEFLIGEDFVLESPAIGKYDGEIVSISKDSSSSRYSLEAHSIMSRLNTDHRLYPMADYNGFDSTYLPVFTLEYWTQQCGIFYSKVPGTPLYFQSQWGHFGAWAKDITRPLKTALFATSEQFQSRLQDGRLMNNIPRNSIATMTFPNKDRLTDMGTTLPVLIPSVGQMVFGGKLGVFGTSRRGHITWNFVDPKGAKKAIRVTADTVAGISLSTSENGTAYTSRGTVAEAVNGVYSFYVGVSQTATATRFEFSVYNAAGAMTGSFAVTLDPCTIRDSLSLTQMAYTGDDTGSGTSMVFADVLVSLMDSVPVGPLTAQKTISTGSKPSSHMVGFSGNVWEHIKQYCSIYHLEVGYVNGLLTIGPRTKDVKVGADFGSFSTSIQNRDTARHVEVINRQHVATGGVVPKLMWSADSVYQVAVGEVQEFVVQTEHSIMDLSQPVCVSGISPFPYKEGSGQYVVTGSDGYIVSPAFWNDQGGSITVDITENEGEIKVRIKGPDFDSERAPYRISEGDAGRPALHVTGFGVKADPKTMKVPTGNSKAAKDVGATVDSPFIGTAKLAYDAAARASEAYAAPETTVTFIEPLGYDEVSAFGTTPAGQLVKRDGNVYRINAVTQTHASLSGNASQHNTIYQLNRNFEGMTLGQVNAYYGDKPIGKVNRKPIKDISNA